MKKIKNSPSVWREALSKSKPAVTLMAREEKVKVGEALMAAYLGDLNIAGVVLPCRFSKRIRRNT